jgi:hypothetical protein
MNNSPHSTIHIGYKEKCVEEMVNTKLLGLQIDKCLKWKNHIELVIPQLVMRIGGRSISTTLPHSDQFIFILL